MVHHMMNTIMPKANNISAIKIHMSRFSSVITSAAIAAVLSGCASIVTTDKAQCSCPKQKQAEETQPVKPALLETSFEDLPDFSDGEHLSWLSAFTRQCGQDNNYLGKRQDVPIELKTTCQEAAKFLANKEPLKNTDAKTWISQHFKAYQLQKEDGTTEGLLTGYFEPELQGSRQSQDEFKHPLYATPADLITVKLSNLYPELKGKRLRGRLQGDDLVPFFSREQWEQIGPTRETPIVWVNDALDAFLLQVQGSGRVELRDGSVIRLSYANQNGHPYNSIGRELVKRGELTVEQATIPGIRDWAKRNPNKLDGLLNSNPSIVFFKENSVLNPEQGPVGALGIPLTAGLSIAIDRQRIAYGTPLWISSTHPINGTPMNQAGLAQDTGGAIRGRVRADYFWGTGPEAGEAAGLARQPLRMWILWPKNAAPPSIK